MTYRPDSKTHTDTRCCRSTCVGLMPLERPRFFAGQLLTETELNSEQGYVLAKSRLHNRYLHGWGVVCGLEVVCNECAGWVSVKPGYAIDACGNDVVVCEETSFDFLKSIRECRRKDTSRPDCDPLVVGEPACKDVDETWCLTLSYQEQEARPTTALRWQRASARAGGECGCGCGGKCSGSGRCSGGYGGGCGGTASAKSSAGRNGRTKTNGYANGHGQARNGGDCGCGCGRGASAATAGVDVCEPTRIRESFRLGTCRKDACCEPERDVTEGTLFAAIRDCFVETGEFVRKRMPARAWNVVTQTMGGGGAQPAEAIATYEAACYLHSAVYDLYATDTHNVRCAAFDVLKKVQLPGAPSNDDDVAGNAAFNKAYADQVLPTLQALVALLVQYIIDCVCEHLLPPCSDDPCDDRLILACITVSGDRIINICNFSCRRFAGSFPVWNWWMSLVPILPLIRQAVEAMCCRDWISARSPVRNTLFETLDRFDPTGAIREAIVARDFATPRAQLSRLAALAEPFSAAALGALFSPEKVNLSLYVNRPAGETLETLKARGLRVGTREVKSEEDIPVMERITAPLTVERDSALVAYTAKGRVMGFARAAGDVAAPAAQPGGPIPRAKRGEQPPTARAFREMRKEIDALRAELVRLRDR